jgi:hypothetical protein
MHPQPLRALFVSPSIARSLFRSFAFLAPAFPFAVLLCATACNDTSPAGPDAERRATVAVPAAGPMSSLAPVAGPLSTSAPQPGKMSVSSPGSDLGAKALSPKARSADVPNPHSLSNATAPETGILWQNTTTGERSIWLMAGTSYSSAVLLSTVPTQWSIAGSGDFNGDGNADIVWQNLTTGDRSIWFMNGTAYSSAVLLPNVPVQWSIAGVGDFNADGKPDLVWQNTITGDRSMWFMNGSSYASAALLPNVPIAWKIVAVGDFNSDGKPDLVWQSASTGQTSIWFMNGSVWSGSFSLLTAVPTAWHIAGAADFDGDGDLDFLWQNVTTGERSIWLMSGSVWNGSAVLLPTVPTQWSIAGVVSHPTASNVSITFCDAWGPAWVGYQDNNGPWTQATAGSGHSYSFDITGGRGAVAVVIPSTTTLNLMYVFYGTAAELAAIGSGFNAVGGCASPTPPSMKGVTVAFPALPTATQVRVTMGFASGIAVSPATTATLSDIPLGATDVVALGQDINSTVTALSILHGVDAPNGGTITLNSWTSVLSSNVTIGNLGTDLANVYVGYVTSRGTTVNLAAGEAGGANQTYPGVPNELQEPGDLHAMTVLATAAAPPGFIDIREVLMSFHTAGDRTLALGPPLANPAITLLANSPNASYSIQLPHQSEYSLECAMSFSQLGGSTFVEVIALSGYVGSASTWDLAVPDLSSAAGFDVKWGLTRGLQTTWSITAAGIPSSSVGNPAWSAARGGPAPN